MFRPVAMGRIKKTPQEKHEASLVSARCSTVYPASKQLHATSTARCGRQVSCQAVLTSWQSPFIADFVKQASTIPLHKLPAYLSTFPQQFPFPREDLYHWIPALNRFDHILELFADEYGLNKGPQAKPFELFLLERGDGEGSESAGIARGEALTAGFSEEGDRELVESVLNFTRIIFEHSANRSLYSSSGHLGHLLNTTSASLLKATLRLLFRLAQRYHTSKHKYTSPHMTQALLAGHYNVDLERLQKLASAFPKKPSAPIALGGTPAKSKDKTSEEEFSKDALSPSDLVSIVSGQRFSPEVIEEFSTVHLTYYDSSATTSIETPAPNSNIPQQVPPVTPTPVRRSSGLGQSSTPGHDDPTETPVRSRLPDSGSANGPKTLQIPRAQTSNTPAWELVRRCLETLPNEVHYDALQRIRVACAFATSKQASDDMVAVRLLAVANLAYVYTDSTFQQKIGQPDSEEPRPYQLVQQLTDFIQLSNSDQHSVSRELEVVALWTLDALTRCKSKAVEVESALNIKVSHGALYFVLRKVIASIAEETANDDPQEDEWRESVFALINTLANTRQGDHMVAAGLMEILEETLRFRTQKAERSFHHIISFFDTFLHNGVRDAFQALVNCKGLDALAELMNHEVQFSLELVNQGKKMPEELRARDRDYQVPFYQQQTLRNLCKFVYRMFQSGTGGANDRELRNLVDTPQVLSSLKTILGNAVIFGSSIWSAAMNIVTNFIHHEPTSYQVIAEAGLSKQLLETITRTEIVVPESGDVSGPKPIPYTPGQSQATGILPVIETMREIPTAFGAICLNESGMRLFQASDALEKFLDIFLSPDHVKALEDDQESDNRRAGTSETIGHAFDELVRHHPALRERVASAVHAMVTKVVSLCNERAAERGVGAKLWTENNYVAGGKDTLSGVPRGALGVPSAGSGSDVHVDAIERDDLTNGKTSGRSTSDHISAVCKFLNGYFHNQNMLLNFTERGGVELLLDLATCPCNPTNFQQLSTFDDMASLFHSMMDYKPHLVLPSILQRTREFMWYLEPLLKHQGDSAFFEWCTSPEGGKLTPPRDDQQFGTLAVKTMVNVHTLTSLLGDNLVRQSHYSRSGSPLYFSQINLTDIYVELVRLLTQLHTKCLWEEISLMERIPKKWIDSTQLRDTRYGSYATDVTMGLMSASRMTTPRTPNEARSQAPNSGALGSDSQNAPDQSSETFQPPAKDDSKWPAYRNTETLRFLFVQLPTGITEFFQALGKLILPKSRGTFLDAYQRQNAATVADEIAQAAVAQLEAQKPAFIKDNLATVRFERAAVDSTVQILQDTESHRGREVLVLVLQKFLQRKGFEQLDRCLQKYCELLPAPPAASAPAPEDKPEAHLAVTGTHQILDFFAKIVQSKAITESHQINSCRQQDITKADYFVGSQLVVEVRHAVLPAVQRVWDSSVVDKLSTGSIKAVIDSLRVILEVDGESHGAVKRSQNAKRIVSKENRKWKLSNKDDIHRIKNGDVDEKLALEGLFRCNDSASAKEYCALRTKSGVNVPRLPPPEDELDEPSVSELTRVPSVEMQDAGASSARSAAGEPEPSDSDDEDTRRRIPADLLNDQLPPIISAALGGPVALGGRRSTVPNAPSTDPPAEESNVPFVTVDDLDDMRTALRDGLIDRCLEVINQHTETSFELADLIAADVARVPDSRGLKESIGETLIMSLMSLRPEQGVPEEPKKVASFAHLLALVLQDAGFFDATLEHLKDNFEYFAGFIRISPDQDTENPSPWISNILLIVERILAEDEQPQRIDWTPPPADNPFQEQKTASLKPPIVPYEEKVTLFEALLDILTKIGKNKSLALSATRTLVILTRHRQLARRLGERLNIQKLFVMIRQLSGANNEKLQSAFMIVLRHIIEDEETIRQVMRSEIKLAFANTRPARPLDTTSYTRNNYHLVLRNPEIFVEVTNEMVQLTRYDSGQRPQPVSLKKTEPKDEDKDEGGAKDKAESEQQTSGESRAPLERTKTSDIKPPAIENPDGVIQFLLRELSSYKDVEDKTPQPAPAKEVTSSVSGDMDMSDSTPTSGLDAPASVSQPSQANKINEKPVFKADQHPTYVYRCFILQCLVELLANYNRTKIEFINFSRKADYQASTPSKPRSGILNYLLNNLIPVGTLNHADDLPHRKRMATSNWAISVVVALCSKTSERMLPTDEEESELVYVRKFVLEHALRAYKDALNSSEALDSKYARLLGLSDLFNRMLTGKPNSANNNNASMDMLVASQKQLGKLMYEKNFITTLTASIAEIDLNFPNAKRAVKYILRPLKWLTDTAITLSTTSDLPNAPGTSEEDEISSATSVSDDDQEREETPDLFRNSTLGQFESGRDDDESGSEDEDDEDMYGDEYDEEMDYEDDEPDHDEAVSDEDEEIEGMEDMGEIEGRPGDVDMDLEIVVDDDDDDDQDDEDDDEGDEDEDDDEDMDDEDEDEGDDIEILEEITGDDENASLGEGGEEEEDWEDEGAGDYDEHDADGAHAPPRPPFHMGTLDNLARVLEDDHSEIMDVLARGDVQIDAGMGNDDYFDDEMPPDDEDEEEEEDYDGEDIIYEPEMEDDEEQMGVWQFDEPGPGLLRSHHHHHHRGDPWGMSLDDRIGYPNYRSHRGGGTPRGNDDGTNPLLQRARTSAGSFLRQGGMRQLSTMDELLLGTRGGGPGGLLARLAGRPAGAGADVVELVGPGGTRINVVGGPPPEFLGGLPQIIQVGGPPPMANLGPFTFPNRNTVYEFMEGALSRRMPPHFHDSSAQPRSSTDPAQAVSFTPMLTVARWQDEARILFSARAPEKAQNVITSILKLLVPPALEAKRLREKAEEERRIAEEEAREEERKKAEAEKAEREAKEKKEREEREAREAEEAAARAREEAERGATEQPMEGVEESQPATETAAESAVSAPRVTTTIRGRELDITNLGIDAEYLEALPEDFREEVIMQQFAEQRSAAVQAGEGQPSEISREFLEALPPDMQQELLRSEAQDRRRRERDEARRRAQASGGGAAAPAQPEELGNADFLAMLDPGLRQSVLMDADDATIAALPPELQAEARGYGRERRLTQSMNRFERMVRGEGGEQQRGDQAAEQEQNRPRRPVVQMLDKAGVATLLRLMFVSMQGSARTTMHGILSDLCKNTQNRAEVISILLSILQDGTADSSALERSFAQLTLRAKQMSGPPKTPLKRSLAGQVAPPNTEMSPLMIVAQCLSTLTTLAHDNPRVASFFLSEHDTITSQRTKASKKGKGKESRASRFPLNALLTLLDRKTIIENTQVMEHLAALLIRVTEPLKILQRRAKEAEKAKEKADAAQPTANAAAAPSADVSMTEGTSANAESAAQAEPSNSDKPQEASAEEKKKHRDLTPPEVPEENLGLVVNIITARDCSSKTLSNVIDIINNLSAIPGARAIFGKELARRAQELGEMILNDLPRLTSQVRSAQSSTDVQGLTLANFSPGSSHQNKLLRVLVALDYIFDPKRAQLQDRPAPDAETMPQEVKEDILSTLYQSSIFIKLWSALSECLTAVRERATMNNVATILQPVIEAFMVVCKTTTLKDAPHMAASQELLMSSPAPESRIENLFFTFTDEHRKILNDLVRHNPKLMSGTFSVLVKNSKVLDFDNKRNYFTRKIHDRSAADRVNTHGNLQLNIRRDQIFLDSFRSLYYKSANEIKYGKLNIRFQGEEGVDAGGVTREWFGALSRQMFDPNYALFNPVASDRTTFHPNPLSEINPEHLTFFKFIGRIIGKALYEGRVLDCHFSRAVYKRVLGKQVSLKDMETLDLDYYKSLCWILENDITDVTFETFSLEIDKFGVIEVVDLIPNGRNVPVTEENKQEYVRLVVEQRLTKSVEQQLDNFLQGEF